MKIHLCIFVLIISLSCTLNLSVTEWCIIIAISGLVMMAECFNSALEAIADAAVPEMHPLIKNAKDMAAGAVLIMAITAAIIGGIIFIPKLSALL